MQLIELLNRAEKHTQTYGHDVKETAFTFYKENGQYHGAIVVRTSTNEIVGLGNNVDEILFNLVNELNALADEQITFADITLEGK